MRRHLVVLLALAVATTAACAYAQEPGRIYRLGILFRNEAGFDLVRAVTLPELARQGFVEGRNLTLENVTAAPSQSPTFATISAICRHAQDASSSAR
jgi:putative ABC transport system substrate-binding protein